MKPFKRRKAPNKKSKHRPVKKNLSSQGTISVHPRGFGFVRIEGQEPDVFIPKHATLDAIDGDLVEIEIFGEVSPKGPEGKVLSIIKRNRSHLAATVIGISKHHYTAYSPALGQNKLLLIRTKKKLREGDRILCEITSWKNSEHIAEGVLAEWLGSIDDPSVDTDVAIHEFSIPRAFPQEAIDEAKGFSNIDTQNRRDLTHLECVTIDPDTAKDFDDAISLTRDDKGHFHLGVHIADVTHFVKPGGPLDQEACKRCNSTYFPGQCVPMLPEELSNVLCSLQPLVKRLTQSVLATFDLAGNLLHYEIVRGAIISKKRFTYREALEILEKRASSPFAPLLERMVMLCKLFQKNRSERGSIGICKSEAIVKVDSKGTPLHMEVVEYDITHQMIEEFMLKANEIVATHLTQANKPVIYRVHEAPAEEALSDFYAFARSLGFSLPAHPKHKDLQKMFEEAKSSPLLPQLSISFIRSMQLAYYFPENLGHYGLVLDHYCHFTSPIRRYSDLIVQRILFDELPDNVDLKEIADLCSKKERVSFKAESSVVFLKKLRLAKDAFAENPQREYVGMITKVKPFALFFEAADFDLEGSLHISEIGDDYYEYNEKKKLLKGRRSGQIFSVGKTIRVMISRIDLIFQQIDWQIY